MNSQTAMYRKVQSTLKMTTGYPLTMGIQNRSCDPVKWLLTDDLWNTKSALAHELVDNRAPILVLDTILE